MSGALVEPSVDHEGDSRGAGAETFRYVVRMEGLPVGTFTGCDGLPSGGDFTYGLAGTIRLTRRVACDSVVLASWLATLERPPRSTVTVTAYDAAGRPVRAWRLRDAWPVRYVGPRTGSAVPIETLELAHSGVLRASP